MLIYAHNKLLELRDKDVFMTPGKTAHLQQKQLLKERRRRSLNLNTEVCVEQTSITFWGVSGDTQERKNLMCVCAKTHASNVWCSLGSNSDENPCLQTQLI